MSDAVEVRQSNTRILLEAGVSARASDMELQVVIDKGQDAVLAAIVFGLCERAERLSPDIASIIDDRGYPMTNRNEVLEPIISRTEMHLRPNDRKLQITNNVYIYRNGCSHLFGRPFYPQDPRSGVSVMLANESADALTGYGDTQATEDEQRQIRGYTRQLFTELVELVDIAEEVDTFSKDILVRETT